MIMKFVNLLGAIIALSLATPAMASDNPWLLVGIDVHQGVVNIRHPEWVAGYANPEYKEGVRTFPTYAACERALHAVIKRFEGKMHYMGEFGYYLCTNWEQWQQ
jgi:hypothetical protein